MAVENPGQGTATLNGTRQASTIRRPYEVTRHGPLHGIGAVDLAGTRRSPRVPPRSPPQAMDSHREDQIRLSIVCGPKWPADDQHAGLILR